MLTAEESGWVVVNNKNGQYVDPEDFVGEFMFQDEEDEDYNQYIKSVKQQDGAKRKNLKEEVKSFFGRASVFGKKVRTAALKGRPQKK